MCYAALIVGFQVGSILRLRLKPVKPDSTPRPPQIPQALRDEIERTPAWWDKRYHALLGETGQPQRELGEPEFIEEMSLTGDNRIYRIPAPQYYVDCTCQDCIGRRESDTDNLLNGPRLTPVRVIEPRL